MWKLQSHAESFVGSSEDSFDNAWARAQALGEGRAQKAADSKSAEYELAFYMNTTPVVADMVEILELHGEWREKEARRLLAARQHDLNVVDHEAIIQRTRWKRGEENFLFWGFSYASVLGATFAAMHPHRIERVVVDSIADADDYYSAAWLMNLQDTDAVVETFFEYCDEAGLERCALYMEGSRRNIKSRFDGIVMSLRGNPIGVPAIDSRAPELMTYTDVANLIRAAAYSPIQIFETLAQVLADISQRNGTSLAVLKQSQQII